MNQRQVVLTVVAVGLVSAALWVWHESSDNADATPAAAPTRATQLPPPSGQAAASDAAATAPVTPPQPEPVSAAPDVGQSAASTPVEPPNVDTPEPAERKFARGAQPQPDPN